MSKLFPILASGIGLFTVIGCSAIADEKIETQKDKASYTIGVQIGSQLSMGKDEIDVNKLMLGLKDALAGAEPRIKKEDMQAAMQEFQKSMHAIQETKMKELSDKNTKDGEAFLADNKKKDGVVTLPSGLQYKVITAGKGATPKATDTVVTHYRGTLIDGKVFDSSYDRGEPATFPVNGVIPGWTEALQKMKVGDKWQLFIPANLAYGENGAGPIAPNSVLIFDIELLEIKKS